MQGARWSEDVVQRAQACIGVEKVVEHAGADDVFEGFTEFGRVFQRKLTHFQVVECVSALQALRECDALCTDIDADDLRARPAHGVMGGLSGAAPGNEDAAVVPIRLVGPEEMRFGAPAPIVPGFAVGV